MKKSNRYLFAWLTALVAIFVSGAFGASVTELLNDGKATFDATHVVTIKYSDFTTTATNTAYTFTNNLMPVAAKTGVELKFMRLVKAFDTGNTNETGSVTVKVGDAGDDDRYLSSTELASDGTEIFGKFGNTVWNSGATNNVTLSYGPVFYTTGTNVTFTFTPNSGEALASNTVGEVQFYFRLYRP